MFCLLGGNITKRCRSFPSSMANHQIPEWSNQSLAPGAKPLRPFLLPSRLIMLLHVLLQVSLFHIGLKSLKKVQFREAVLLLVLPKCKNLDLFENFTVTYYFSIFILLWAGEYIRKMIKQKGLYNIVVLHILHICIEKKMYLHHYQWTVFPQ